MVFFGPDVDVCSENLVVEAVWLGSPFFPLRLDVMRFTAAAALVVVADLFVFFVDNDVDGRVVFPKGDGCA
jgi:hypothetical protein